MGTITVDIFAPPIRYWHRRGNHFDEWRKGLWTTTRLTAIADWIQFYSANQIIGILLQARGHAVPGSFFTASFPPHFTCFACI
jgi:hypothetical protein